jgi:PE family
VSFVIAAPEMVQAAAQGLAGIRSTLGEATAAAAGPTTAVVAAAEDEVSAGVAAVFGAFGQEYQVINAQAQALHEQFVNLLNAGAGAYLSTEVANVEQALTNAVNAPAQALLGSASASSAAAGSSAGSAGTIIGPYRSLVTNTVANLQGIGNIWSNVTAPALLRAITTQTNPQLIVAALEGNPPIFSTAGQMGQGYANLIQALTVPVSLSVTSLNPPNASLAVGLGLPQLLAYDALGAPVNAAIAATASNTAFFNAVQTGKPLAAVTVLVDAPANIANAFLNGEQTVSVPLPGLPLTVVVPLSGLLVPLQPFTTTATLVGNPLLQTVTITGPPVGGLVPALLEYTPLLLASAFGG